MSVLADILWQALRADQGEKYMGLKDPEFSQKRDEAYRYSGVAIAQFARASGPEQADVIRALHAQALSDEHEKPWHNTRTILSFLCRLVPHINFEDCVDDPTRQKVKAMLDKIGIGSVQGPDGKVVDWHEIARYIEGRRSVAPFATDDERWKSWFIREAERHERICGKNSQGSVRLRGDPTEYSLEHAKSCREAAERQITPSYFYELRQQELDKLFEKADQKRATDIPEIVVRKVDELRKTISTYEHVLTLEGNARVNAFEELTGRSSHETQALKEQDLREQNPEHEQMLKQLGL